MKRALLFMGYRWIGPFLGKPVGGHLFVFDLKTNEWKNFFVACNTKRISLYEANKWSGGTHEEALSQLKQWEAYTRINVGAVEHSQFGFLTPDQAVEHYDEITSRF